LFTGNPVVGEELKETLRVLYPLRRVDAVAVDGSPPSTASGGRGSPAPVGIDGGGVSVREGRTRVATGEDAVSTDGDDGLIADTGAAVGVGICALKVFLLLARPLLAAAAGNSE